MWPWSSGDATAFTGYVLMIPLPQNVWSGRVGHWFFSSSWWSAIFEVKIGSHDFVASCLDLQPFFSLSHNFRCQSSFLSSSHILWDCPFVPFPLYFPSKPFSACSVHDPRIICAGYCDFLLAISFISFILFPILLNISSLVSGSFTWSKIENRRQLCVTWKF